MPCLSEGATQYLLTTSSSAALIVNLPSTNIRTDLLYKSFNILATNPANSKWNYLGAAASLGYEDLRVPSNIALITGTKGELGPISSCWPLTQLSHPRWTTTDCALRAGDLRRNICGWIPNMVPQLLPSTLLDLGQSRQNNFVANLFLRAPQYQSTICKHFSPCVLLSWTNCSWIGPSWYDGQHCGCFSASGPSCELLIR